MVNALHLPLHPLPFLRFRLRVRGAAQRCLAVALGRFVALFDGAGRTVWVVVGCFLRFRREGTAEGAEDVEAESGLVIKLVEIGQFYGGGALDI